MSGNLIDIPEVRFNEEPQPVFDYHSLDGQSPTICIDNGMTASVLRRVATNPQTSIGAYSWRAGFSSSSAPYIDRINMVSRYKERKFGKNVLLFGGDTDADANSRSNARSMFDGDLLIQGDMLVSSFLLWRMIETAQRNG